MLNKLLFVCTGNTCRSPMAEGISKKISENENKTLEIYSCGIYADTGSGASEKAVMVCAEKDVDISEHTAKGISLKLLEDVDLILTMTTIHKQWLIRNVPKLKHKVYTLKEYNGNDKSQDIKDPFGQDIKIYRECVNELIDEIKKIIKCIK